jgi:antitoxin HicB
MRFIIGAKSYEIDKSAIIRATNGVSPKPFDRRNRYYVELHGLKYPIKQTIHLVTGLSYTTDFTAQYAHHILKKLGFTIHSIQVAHGTRPAPRITARAAAGEGIQKFAVTLAQDEDGFIVASCPALPGCHSQGGTDEEAIANIREAIRGYIASLRRHGEPVPAIKEVREVEVLG